MALITGSAQTGRWPFEQRGHGRAASRANRTGRAASTHATVRAYAAGRTHPNPPLVDVRGVPLYRPFGSSPST
jgi:hypothetical protein